MAVIVKYIVVRNGKEVMTCTSKKEADAHDKLLDIAENLHEFLQQTGVEMADAQLDELTFHLAKHRDAVVKLLKGGKVADAGEGPAAKPKPAAEPAPAAKPKAAGKRNSAPAGSARAKTATA